MRRRALQERHIPFDLVDLSARLRHIQFSQSMTLTRENAHKSPSRSDFSFNAQKENPNHESTNDL